MLKKQRGQSILEVVFSVGLISLVTAGVVMLLSATLGARTKATDRKKAVEMSQIVMEGVVGEKSTNSVEFWDVNSGYWQNNLSGGKTLSGYPGYDYTIGIVQDTRPGCSGSTWECAEVSVAIGFSGSTDRPVFTKFFTKR